MADETKTFFRIRDYAWDTNAEFQSGLRTILASAPEGSNVATLTNRAKCFYFQKKTAVPVNDMHYQEWLESSPPARYIPEPVGSGTADTVERTGGERIEAGGGGAEDDAPYPKSFAEVVELITTGKPIPGIKEIPDVVLEAPKEPSSVPVRRKPWEREEEAAGVGNGGAGKEAEVVVRLGGDVEVVGGA